MCVIYMFIYELTYTYKAHIYRYNPDIMYIMYTYKIHIYIDRYNIYNTYNIEREREREREKENVRNWLTQLWRSVPTSVVLKLETQGELLVYFQPEFKKLRTARATGASFSWGEED